MSKPAVTEDQRAEAADMGWEICEDCGTIFIPALGYINDGHQCNEDGLQEKYVK